MIKAATSENIIEAAEILKSGGLVGMPTETVYGLAGNALDDGAVAKIFAAKGRPAFNPLILHVPDLAQAESFVEVSDEARHLAKAFWPGALTLILPRKDGGGISDLASAGLDTIAVRVPAHPVALSLLKLAGVPVAAPSANKSGRLSPTSPAHVQEQLGGMVDMILAAGRCAVGVESTVLDLSGTCAEILRAGAVTAAQIGDVLGVEVLHALHDQSHDNSPKSPGMLLKHYAPNMPIRLNAVDLGDDEALLGFGRLQFMATRSGVLASDLPDARVRNLSESGDLEEAAANLFSMLRALDDSGAARIAVMAVPEVGIGIAVNDRLRRAAESIFA